MMQWKWTVVLCHSMYINCLNSKVKRKMEMNKCICFTQKWLYIHYAFKSGISKMKQTYI